MKHDRILTEAAHSKMTVEESIQLAEDFCLHHAWGLDFWREPMTVLAAEVVRLRELVQRARDMIDLSPDSPPWTWPTADQIDQLVRDCDAVLIGRKNHD